MNVIRISYIVLAFTLLAGCTTPPLRDSSKIEITQSASYSPEHLPSPTPETGVTFVPKDSEIHTFCPEIDTDASGETSGLTGTIVLAGDDISFNNEKFSPDNSQKSILLFWNSSLGKKITYQLPEQQLYYYYLISPDKKKLAMTEGKTLSKTAEVLVLTAEGQQEATFTLPDDWTLFDWLNNEKMLLRQIRLRGENLNLVLVDPVTNEQQFLPSDFPNLYSDETLTSWGALTVFDPTASLVVYPERKENSLISIVWDVRGKREITRIAGGDWPKWSPSGNRLLIVADQEAELHRRFNEIFIVTPQGSIARSTFFKDNFENSKISLPVWSPNGRYIAFWLSTVLPVKTATLAILDTEALTVDLYCKEVNPFPYRFGEINTLGYAYYQVNAAPPIWSPDSKYLLIEDYQDSKSSTYLFDLQSHSITKIADNARPVGWLK